MVGDSEGALWGSQWKRYNQRVMMKSRVVLGLFWEVCLAADIEIPGLSVQLSGDHISAATYACPH